MRKQFLISVILLVAACANVHAATIQETNNKRCAFKLEGAISTGDYDRLSNVISRNATKIDLYDERTSSICLKSFGGSYVEALEIAEFIYNRGISTVIEYNSECFSACAIIFMAGVAPNRLMPLRELSAGGILGFHAPYLTMPDEKYSKEEVENIAQGMRMAILALVRFSSKRTKTGGGDFIKQSLLSKILEKGPQDVLFVKTIFDAARWDILIYDAAENFKIDTDTVIGIKNICKNFHYSNMDEDIPSNVNLSVKVEQYSSKFIKDDGRILVQERTQKNEAYSTVCEIYPRQFRGMNTVSLFACSFDYWSDRQFGDCREFKTETATLIGKPVPNYFALDPNTLLKSFKN
jgi:hypothetical protein